MHNRRDNISRFNSHSAPGANHGKWGTTHTMRAERIVTGIGTDRTSRNMMQASLKALRLYKRICRLVRMIYYYLGKRYLIVNQFR